MTVNEAIAILSKITYKPGWRIHIRPRPDMAQGIDVRISFKTLHVHTNAPITIEQHFTISGFDLRDAYQFNDEEAVLSYLFNILKGMEEHESREWYRYDGRQVYETH